MKLGSICGATIPMSLSQEENDCVQQSHKDSYKEFHLFLASHLLLKKT